MKKCPKCDSTEVVPTIWTFPDKETEQKVRAGQLIATCNPNVTSGCRKCWYTW